MEPGIIIAVIKGVCIGAFLFSIDKDCTQVSWWVAMISLTIALNI